MRSLLPLCLASVVSGQLTRYRDPVFTAAVIQRDVAYGAAVNRYTSRLETLLLDLYQPAGDPAPARPAVVVAHGGGFVSGDKGLQQMADLCMDFARRGYVAVSINYRLQPPTIPINQQTIIDAKEDAKAAVRCLRANAASWRVDVDRVAGMGTSAGAYAVLEAAYTPGEGQSGNPGFRSDLQAVVDLWGALVDLDQMQPGEAPVCIIHGTEDPSVPYFYGAVLDLRATLVGVPHELHPLIGAGHAPWQLLDQFRPEFVAFLYEHLRLGQLSGLAARPGFTSPGGLTLDTFGIAGDFALRFASGARRELDLGVLGTLGLDPARLVFVASVALPAVPRLPSAALTLPVPAGLAGVSIWWQEIHVTRAARPRTLTNYVGTSF